MNPTNLLICVFVIVIIGVILACGGLREIEMPQNRLCDYQQNDTVTNCQQNDIVTLGWHNVTFVVANTRKCPRANMRIDITNSNKTLYNTTGIDGSCVFELKGSTKYEVKLYDENIRENFELYPVKYNYLVII